MRHVYEVLLARDLERRGLAVMRQKPVSFEIDGLRFDEGLRIDLLVNDRVVVELKSVEKLAPVHSKQVLMYLRRCSYRSGADQLWRSNSERRPGAHCQSLRTLSISASAREPAMSRAHLTSLRSALIADAAR
jgi:hypothetical protein